MKKLVSLLLVVAMFISFSSYVLAEEMTELGTPRKETLIVEFQTPTDM